MTTKRVPPTVWTSFFDRFTRQHLRDDLPETVTIEVVSPEVGDQKSNSLEVVLEGSDHLVFRPVDIWVTENETDRFLETIDLVRADGTKEILHLHRSGVPA